MEKYTLDQLKKMYDKSPNMIANIFLEAGYSPEKIINYFNNTSKDSIIIRAKKISDILTQDTLGKVYDKNPNEIAKIFIEAGMKPETVEQLFNSSSKEHIVSSAKELKWENKISSFIPTEFYNIPKEYMNKDRKETIDKLNGTINKKTGELLEQMYNYESDKYIIGIHRTGVSNIEDNIFKDGICYNNTSPYGNIVKGEYTTPYLYDHVQRMDDFVSLLNEIKNCENYKGARGCIITKIPKNGIGESNNPLPLYYVSKDGNLYLKPEYVCAYIPVRSKIVGECIFNKSKKNIYEDETQFVYDQTSEKSNSYIKSLGFSNIFLLSMVILTLIFIFMFIIK